MGRIPPTRKGYQPYEVVSALQKEIRRSSVDGALYWGWELYEAGYANWAWKRLRIIMSEDIGAAAPPGSIADVEALYRTAMDTRKREPKRANAGGMFFCHAVVIAARCPKSRLVDLALFAFIDEERDVPDYALDMHTLRGKQMGRGPEHFLEEGGKLVQPGGLAKGDPEYPIPADLDELEQEYERRWLASRYGIAKKPELTPDPDDDEARPGEGKKNRRPPGQTRLLP